MKPRAWLAILLVLGAGFYGTACGDDESREDADDSPNGTIEKSEPNVAAFNNHFPNVQHKCLYARPESNVNGIEGDPRGVGEGIGLRVIETSGNHGSRVVVIADPHCPGYMPEQAGTVGQGGNSP
jgi:hypothetical protein